MAARTFFLALIRNQRGHGKISSRSLTSSSEAVSQDHINRTHEENYPDDCSEDEKDDLRSRIFRVRLPKRSATNVLQNWVGEGNEITISELRNISNELRRSKRYKHALEISEWMVSHDEYDLSDTDYGIRIHLMTKVFGVDAAERYFQALPQSAKTSETYTALLHCYAELKLIEKAEEFYEKTIKKSNLSLSAITYNELMTLYMSVGQLEKVTSIIKDMKDQNVAPDLFTYNLWVSSRAAAFDFDEARKILDEMNLDPSCDENWFRYLKLADIYFISSQLVNPDFNSLVEPEKEISQRELISCDFLFILYGGLGNKDKIDQIWKSLKMARKKIGERNYLCVISSYLILGHLKEAGEIIDEWKQSASSEFNGSMCRKLLEALKEVELTDEEACFRTLLREKGCEIDELE